MAACNTIASTKDSWLPMSNALPSSGILWRFATRSLNMVLARIHHIMRSVMLGLSMHKISPIAKALTAINPKTLYVDNPRISNRRNTIEEKAIPTQVSIFTAAMTPPLNFFGARFWMAAARGMPYTPAKQPSPRENTSTTR